MTPSRLFYVVHGTLAALLAAFCVALALLGDRSPVLLVLFLTYIAVVGIDLVLYLNPGDFG